MRHVVVTGGSRGIGAAAVQAFLAQGDRVTALSRSGDAPDGARGVKVDLTDSTATLSVVADLGDIDVLVLCAGAARQVPLADLDLGDFRNAMEGKYFSYVNIMMPVVKRMVARGSGIVLPVIGMGGKSASPLHLSGGAANAALMLVTTGLGAAHAKDGLRIVGLNPGPVATGRFQQMAEAHAKETGQSVEAARAELSARFPSGKITEPEDLADMLVLLASDGARAVNGTVIAMDGGATPII